MSFSNENNGRAAKVKQAKEKLDGYINELAEQMKQGKSENLIKYLEFSAQLHQYSFGNILLALFQKSDISRLAGIKTWNKLGRYVCAGEKGIMILAPMEVKKRKNKHGSENDGEEDNKDDSAEAVEYITLFKPVYVYDISQTTGKDLPSLIHAKGDVSAIQPILENIVRNAGITVEYVDCIPFGMGARGASHKGKISILKTMEPSDIFRALVHEFAHEKLHWKEEKMERRIRETEADATAFVVCRHFGIKSDTSDYLLIYDSSPKILLERLENIRQTAADIIEAIENPVSNTD